MADMKIKPDEITSILKERIEGIEDGGTDLSEVGTVLSIADGIGRVHGLDNCMSLELLELPHDVTGLALNLESDNVGAVLFGDWDRIEEGDQVKRTGRLLEVPVGDALLGRIVDPLGRPLDGRGDVDTSETRPAEFKAPGVVQRQPVEEPVQTGIKAIDSMIPIGRGQRELIIGDRQTGKSTVAIDTIINNRDNPLGVYDTLTTHAWASREMSLLLPRPPGREAYPGDVFYLHSRLLERCAKLSDDLGAGSMTGLPLVETKGNDVSAYIPTNVISITDGQIFLETGLFNSGVRPAINVGISVSRVGGSAQIKAMKSVAGRLRLDLAQYRELEAFASFSSDLDASSRATLERGQRLVELLKQGQYQPYPVEREVVSIWLGTTGKLDKVPVPEVRRFEREFLDYVARNHGGVFDGIRQSRALGDDAVSGLERAVEDFYGQFQTAEGGTLRVNEDEAEAMDASERGQERVQVKRSA